MELCILGEGYLAGSGGWEFMQKILENAATLHGYSEGGMAGLSGKCAAENKETMPAAHAVPAARRQFRAGLAAGNGRVLLRAST